MCELFLIMTRTIVIHIYKVITFALMCSSCTNNTLNSVTLESRVKQLRMLIIYMEVTFEQMALKILSVALIPRVT
jgi:hypothetical protein